MNNRYRLYPQTRTETDQTLEVANQIMETIDDDSFKEKFKQAIGIEMMRSTIHARDGSFEYLGKIIFSGVLPYLIYATVKDGYRQKLTDNIIMELDNNIMSNKQALYAFLSEPWGGTDLKSMKYNVLNFLFQFNAKSDAEANAFVKASINALGGDNVLELNTVKKPNNSF